MPRPKHQPNQLFANDTTPDPQGDGETTPHDDQVKSIEDETCPLEGNQMVKEKDGEAPGNQW